MNKTIYIPLFLAILLTACCKEKVYKLQPLTAEMASIYQDGIWWKYANQDSSLIDCVYVSNRKEFLFKEGDCDKTINTIIEIKSNYLFQEEGKKISFWYIQSNINSKDQFFSNPEGFAFGGPFFSIDGNNIFYNQDSLLEIKNLVYQKRELNKCLEYEGAIYSLEYGCIQIHSPWYETKKDTFYLVETNLW